MSCSTRTQQKTQNPIHNNELASSIIYILELVMQFAYVICAFCNRSLLVSKLFFSQNFEIKQEPNTF